MARIRRMRYSGAHSASGKDLLGDVGGAVDGDGRPHADHWVWDQQLDAILGSARGGIAASLQTLLQHVADDERSLVADAFRAAVEHGDPVNVSCRLHTGGGGVRSVLITAELSDNEPN